MANTHLASEFTEMAVKVFLKYFRHYRLAGR